jgi:serine/threonine-protein kinase RsbW/stage II sporulation protein AB (anti-sigma F factor)
MNRRDETGTVNGAASAPRSSEAPADVDATSAASYGAGTKGDGRPEADYSLQRFSETRAAYAINVVALRRAVVAFADAQGATRTALGSIGLAVGEALNNIVIHAYRDDVTPGSMTVDAHRELAHLAIAVIDEGQGFGPRADSPGLGLGMPVIASLTATLSVAAANSSSRPGTIVLMGFALD